MKINSLIIRVLRKVKTNNGKTALDELIQYLHNEGVLVKEIANMLEISPATVYKSLKVRKGRVIDRSKVDEKKGGAGCSNGGMS
jgi:predicted transcriptional regulator